MRTLDRLLRPETVAVIGGGAWCEAVISQCQKLGFDGNIWPVHPERDKISGFCTFKSLEELPSPPDATFIGINRNATVEAVTKLAKMNAGGAVCFASGFQESEDGEILNQTLLDAAGDMPILGPNCYGFINALDRVCLWPDQHGLVPVERGVAIVAQSSNIAINLTMQQRGLPIGALMTVGNQSALNLATVAHEWLLDKRITALGLYIESFDQVRDLEALAKKAHKLGKRIIAMRSGKSDKSRIAAISHTASMSGGGEAAGALLRRLGIAEVEGPGAFIEALKVAHLLGKKRVKSIASLSCSGGEAGLMADLGHHYDLVFPDPDNQACEVLKGQLGSYVAITNPLDYHTDVWRDRKAMGEVFAAMAYANIDLTILVLDVPHPTRCNDDDWYITIKAVEDAAKKTGQPFAVLATMAENLPEHISVDLMACGILPLHDAQNALSALSTLSSTEYENPKPVHGVTAVSNTVMLSEFEAKQMLEPSGIPIARGVEVTGSSSLGIAAKKIGYPIVLKRSGLAHKSDHGGVVLNIQNGTALQKAAAEMGEGSFLLETMITGSMAELMVGILADPPVGYVLSLAAGGTLSEILNDRVTLLVPASRTDIEDALGTLRISPVLNGYRGASPASIDAIVDAIDRLQQFVINQGEEIRELEINPLICREKDVIIADALINRKCPND